MKFLVFVLLVLFFVLILVIILVIILVLIVVLILILILVLVVVLILIIVLHFRILLFCVNWNYTESMRQISLSYTSSSGMLLAICSKKSCKKEEKSHTAIRENAIDNREIHG